jgi:pimeloyl-ACP methyl ester carboxylesterase
VVRIEGGSHASNLTHPDQVNGPLIEFLQSL